MKRKRDLGSRLGREKMQEPNPNRLLKRKVKTFMTIINTRKHWLIRGSFIYQAKSKIRVSGQKPKKEAFQLETGHSF